MVLAAHRDRRLTIMRQDEIAFVLWADRFDETQAAFFVAELRKAGLRVKLVSLAGQPSSGAYGLTLAPDLMLEQALLMAPTGQCRGPVRRCVLEAAEERSAHPALSGPDPRRWRSRPAPWANSDGEDAMEAVRRVVGQIAKFWFAASYQQSSTVY